MKTNQYKLTLYEQPDGSTRVEIWWYEPKVNPITGELVKTFQWWAEVSHGDADDLFDLFQDVRHFLTSHYPNSEAYWPLSDTKGKEPKRDKNSQFDFQF